MKSLVLLLILSGVALARRIPNYEESPPEQCPEASLPPSKQIVCYYGGRTPVSQINPCLCTHLVFSSGAGLTDNFTLHIDSGLRAASRALRLKNPGLQLLLSVGGRRVNTETAETLLKSDEKRARFADSVGRFLRKSGLNGIELDLKLNTDSSARSAKSGLVSLVKALRSELDSEFELVDREKRDYSVSERIVDDITTSEWTPTRPDGSSARIVRRPSSSTTSTEGSTGEAAAQNYLALEKATNKKLLLLRVPVFPELVVKRFDLKNISRYIDYITVPTHNISDSTESGLTYHPSRLMGLADMLNTDSVMDLLTGLGAPHNMVIISIPSAATRFSLKDPESNAPRSPLAGRPQLISQTKLCRMLSKGGWTMERDEDLTAPYAFRNSTWLAFDDQISVGIKSKYVLLRDLAGAAIYQLDDEDWAGACTRNKSQDSPYLLKTLYQSFTELARKPRGALLQSLEEDVHESTLLTFSGEVELSPYRIVRVIDNLGAVHVVRKNAKTEFECSRQGYFSHPLGCNRFYRCVKFNQYSRDYTVFEYDCPAGLAFDERWEVCVWPGSLPRGSPCTGSSEIAPVPRQRYSCPRVEGYYADPENCRWFFACLDHARDGATPLTAYEFRCPFGLVFDESKLLCDWPWSVDGCGAAGRAGYVGAALYGSASRLQYESGYSSYSASSAVYSSESGSAHTSHGSSAYLGLAQKANAAYSSALHSGIGLQAAAGQGVLLGSGAGVAGAQGVLVDSGLRANTATAGLASGRAAYAADSYNAGRQYSSYASLPDTLVSGGRIANSEGVILGENIALSGIEGGRFGLAEGLAGPGGAAYGARLNAVNAAASSSGAGLQVANIAAAEHGAGYNAAVNLANAQAAAANIANAQAAQQQASLNAAVNEAASRANAQAAYQANVQAAQQQASLNAAANEAANRANAQAAAAYQANVQVAQQQANLNAAANEAANRANAQAAVAYEANVQAAQQASLNEAVNVAANRANAQAAVAYQANVQAAQQQANINAAANLANAQAIEHGARLNAAANFVNSHAENLAHAQAAAAEYGARINAANAANSASLYGSAILTGNSQGIPIAQAVPVASTVPVVGSYGQRARVIGPTAVPVIQPVVQAAAQPVVQPLVEQVPTAVYTRPVIRTRPAVVQTVVQPTVQPVIQPVVEQVPTAVYTRPVVRTRPAVVQPYVVQPTAQPVIQQVPSVVYRGPRVRPVVQPTVQSVVQPVQPIVQQVPTAVYTRPVVRARPIVAQPTIQANFQPVIEQVPSVAYNAPRIRTRPTVQPVIQQVYSQQPTAQPLLQPVAQPTIQPLLQPFVQPAVQPLLQPVVQPTVQPLLQPVVQPVVQQVPVARVRPTVQPLLQTVVQPTIASYQRRPQARVQQLTVSTAAPPVVGYSYSRPVAPATLSVTPSPAPVAVTPASVSFNRAFYSTGSSTATPLLSSTTVPLSVIRSGLSRGLNIVSSTPAPATYIGSSGLDAGNVYISSTPAPATYVASSGRIASGLDAGNVFVSSTPASPSYIGSSGRFSSGLDAGNVLVSSTPAPATYSGSSGRFSSGNVYVSSTPTPDAYVAVTPPSPAITFSAGRRRPSLGLVSTISPIGGDSIAQYGQRPAFGIPAAEIAAAYELQGYDAVGADYALYNSSRFGVRTFSAPAPTTVTPATVSFARGRARLPAFSTPRPNFLDVVSSPLPGSIYVAGSSTVAPGVIGLSSTTSRPLNVNAYVAAARLAQDRIAGVNRAGSRSGSGARTNNNSNNNVESLLNKYSGNFGGLLNGNKDTFVSNVLVSDSLSRISTVGPSTAAPIAIESTTSGYSGSARGYSSTAGYSGSSEGYSSTAGYSGSAGDYSSTAGYSGSSEGYSSGSARGSSASQQYSGARGGYSSSQRGQLRQQASRTGSNSRVVEALLSTYSGNFGGILNNDKEGFISQVISGDSGSRLTGRVSTTTARPVPSTTEAIFRQRPASSRGQQVRIEDSSEDLNVQALLDQYSGKFGGVLSSDNEAFISGVLTGDVGRGRSQAARGRGYVVSSTEASTASTGNTAKPDNPVVIVTRLSDVNPLLIAKLGAQCTCKSNTVTLNRNRGPARGRARVNYDEDSDGDDDSGEGYGRELPSLRLDAGSPRFSTEAPFLSTIPVQAAAPVSVVVPSSTIRPAIVSTTPFSTPRGRVSVYRTPVTVAPTLSIASVQPALGAVRSPVLVNSPSPNVAVPVVPAANLAIPVAPAANLAIPVAPAANLAIPVAPAAKLAIPVSPVTVPVSTVGVVQPTQFAGRAFDRYGPGGWRSVDETLQGSVDCQRAGLFRHPKYCNKFYACHWDEWKKRFTLHVFNCPVHLAYDQSVGACNWPSQGPACTDNNLLV